MAADLPSIRILVVDDDRAICDFVTTILERDGFEVKSIQNPLLAEEEVKKGDYHLVILDVMMPKIDGYMVCRLLKFDEKYQGIPIIMLTARSLDEDRDLGLSSGADDYITKPIDFDVLLKKVKSFLALKPTSK